MTDTSTCSVQTDTHKMSLRFWGDNETYAQRDQIFQNNGDGTYTDVSASAGAYFSEPFVGRAAATADYDNDSATRTL